MTQTGMAVFAVVFTQCSSFLEILKSLHKRRARSNAHTLFNLEPIPTDNNIRNMLDGVPSERFDNLFLSSQADTLQGGGLAMMQT